MDSHPLAGTLVWVSRPAGQAAGFANILTSAGARVLVAPAMTIEPLADSHPAMGKARAIVQDLDHYQHVICISTNAVDAGLALIDSYWPQLPQGQHWYAIGSATAAALANWGITASQGKSTAMNSEALMTLPELQQISGERVLIIRGQGGRPWLGQQFEAQGARVEYLEVYQRTCPDNLANEVSGALSTGQLDFITAASGATVENICQLIEDRLQGQLFETPLVVPGERVASVAKEMGFNQVLAASNASAEAMIEAMAAYKR